MDIIHDDFPKADLMICRDCMPHLTFRQARDMLDNFMASGIAYFLATTHHNSDGSPNKDIEAAGFRLIDLFAPPYCFPTNPLVRIEDWIAPHPRAAKCASGTGTSGRSAGGLQAGVSAARRPQVRLPGFAGLRMTSIPDRAPAASGGPMIAPKIAPLRALVCVIAATALALTAGASAPAAAVPMPKPRPAASDKAKITTDTKVYLLRGLLNIFSLGMDALSDKLNAMGIKAEVFNHDSWPSVASKIATDYKNGQKGAVVLIGHSLGADVVFSLAEKLDAENIPVRLIVPFDPTSTYEVPKNVDYLLNLYQLNGFGRRVNPGKGFRGELVNMDLSKDESFGHGSIDKSEKLHGLVIEKIKKVALGPAPKKRPAPAKPKPVVAQETSKDTSQEMPKEMPAIPFIAQPQTTQ